MRKLLMISLVVMFFASCEKDDTYSYEGFEPIIADEIYSSLLVQQDYKYYEIRNNFCFDSTSYDIIYSEGIAPYSDSIFTNALEGVFYSNGDLCMYNNVLVNIGDDYTFLKTYAEIVNFLGPIDSRGDALFVAHLNGYYFKYEDKEFGIKEDTDGYLIYACKLISACLPVQTDKFLIRIDVDANIEIREQTVLTRYDEGCI